MFEFAEEKELNNYYFISTQKASHKSIEETVLVKSRNNKESDANKTEALGIRLLYYTVMMYFSHACNVLGE